MHVFLRTLIHRTGPSNAHFCRPLAHREQALRQASIAPGDAIVPDGYLERVGLPYKDAEAFGACNRGVEQVALQQHTMLGDERNDDNGILAALALVDGDGVGQPQIVQFMELLADAARTGLPYEFDIARGAVFVDAANPANVAVEDALVVVVARLHDFIADAQNSIAPFYLCNRRGVEMSLEPLIERGYADRSLVHRREHLDIGERVEVIACREPTLDEIEYQMLGA